MRKTLSPRYHPETYFQWVDSGDDVQHRALAGAVRTDQRADLPRATPKLSPLSALIPLNDRYTSRSCRIGSDIARHASTGWRSAVPSNWPARRLTASISR